MHKPVSKDDVIAAVQECARKLGRPPSLAEFEWLSGISQGKMRRHFEGIGDATRAAGLKPNPGSRTGPRALLMDWAQVAGCPTFPLSTIDRWRTHNTEVAPSFAYARACAVFLCAQARAGAKGGCWFNR